MSAYEDIDNLDHELDIAIALGNMVVAWARAEGALINVFAAVSGMHIDMATATYFRIPSGRMRSGGGSPICATEMIRCPPCATFRECAPGDRLASRLIVSSQRSPTGCDSRPAPRPRDRLFRG